LVLVEGAACISGHGDCVERLEVCDIALESCQQHVFTQTACAREFDGRDAPIVHEISRNDFADLLRDDEEPTADEVRADAQEAASERMLSLLAPGATSSEDAAIESYASNVLAFYSRDDQSVTIIETNLADADEETSVFVLSHEFVHAQQDVDVGLQDYFDEFATTADSDTATRSISEGEAMLFANLTMARMPGARIDTEAFDDYYEDSQDDLRAAAEDPAAADYTTLAASFPYPFGGQLVTHRWYDKGRLGVLDLYDDPPRSTAEILSVLAGDKNAEVDVDIPASSFGTLPDGWSLVGDETLGAWIVYAVALRNGVSAADADALAKAWLGDRLIVVGGPAETDVALGWTVRFRSGSAAAAFAMIGDVPPPEGVRSVEQTDDDVVLVAAVDDDALATWQASFEPASVEPAPFLRSQSGRTGRRWDHARKSR
jgi:hypothetical protein